MPAAAEKEPWVTVLARVAAQDPLLWPWLRFRLLPSSWQWPGWLWLWGWARRFRNPSVPLRPWNWLPQPRRHPRLKHRHGGTLWPRERLRRARRANTNLGNFVRWLSNFKTTQQEAVRHQRWRQQPRHILRIRHSGASRFPVHWSLSVRINHRPRAPAERGLQLRRQRHSDVRLRRGPKFKCWKD